MSTQPASADAVHVQHATTNNLRGVSVTIPHGQITVVTGISGSGKSSLVFDTILAESNRRFLETIPARLRQKFPSIEAPQVEAITGLPLAIGLGQWSHPNRARVAELMGIDELLAEMFIRAGTFHCPVCDQTLPFDPPNQLIDSLSTQANEDSKAAIVSFPLANDKPLNDEQIRLLIQQGFVRYRQGTTVGRLDDLLASTRQNEHDTNVEIVLDRLTLPKADDAGSLNRWHEVIHQAYQLGNGRLTVLIGDSLHVYCAEPTCLPCQQTLARPTVETLLASVSAGGSDQPTKRSKSKRRSSSVDGELPPVAVRLLDQTVAQWWQHRIDQLPELIAEVLNGAIDAPTPRHSALVRLENKINEVMMRTQRLGLGYLQLDRVGRSLSTSESRRLQLAQLVDQHMTQLLILLDEPSAGLTEQETSPLAELIRDLQQLGHTLVLCEHSASMIGLADHIIEVGPGAGDQGGTITFQGAIADLPEDQRSVTRLALQPTPPRKKTTKDKSSEALSLSHVNGRGFVDAEFTIPLQGMTILTGPSGSGKRSLVHHAIIPALQQQLALPTDKPSPAKNPHVSTEDLPTITFQASLTGKPRDVLIIDQQLGQPNSRSVLATYIKIFDELRELFGETNEAKIKGLSASHFSFNQADGRCPDCDGAGYRSVTSGWLPIEQVRCESCRGQRFKPSILEVKCRGLNIAEVLNLTAHEAFGYARGLPKVQRKLATLREVGLDYVRLGQQIDQLSFGERKRLKLADCLGRKTSVKTLIVLEEPSVGLHRLDLEQLITLFDSLMAIGYSFLIIDQHPQLLAHAHRVIELTRT